MTSSYSEGSTGDIIFGDWTKEAGGAIEEGGGGGGDGGGGSTMEKLTGSKQPNRATRAQSAPPALRASPLGHSVEGGGAAGGGAEVQPDLQQQPAAATVVMRRPKRSGKQTKQIVEEEAAAKSETINAVALYDYAAADADEVSLQEGDVVVDVMEAEEGWLKGTVARTGVRGTLPTNYVKVNLVKQHTIGSEELLRPSSVVMTDVDGAGAGASAGNRSSSLGVSAVSLYDYEAADVDEVSCKEGDVFVGVREVQDGWLKGTLVRTGARGTVPSNYVSLQTDGVAAAAAVAKRKKSKRKSKRKSVRESAAAAALPSLEVEAPGTIVPAQATAAGSQVDDDDNPFSAAAAEEEATAASGVAEGEEADDDDDDNPFSIAAAEKEEAELVASVAVAEADDDVDDNPFSIAAAVEQNEAAGERSGTEEGSFSLASAAVDNIRLSSAVALYDYAAADADEVSLQEGDVIVDVTEAEEGWLTGTVARTGVRGTLPTNYVKITASSADTGDVQTDVATAAKPSSSSEATPNDVATAGSADDVTATGSIDCATHTALYDYIAADTDEISICVGDIFSNVSESASDGWVTATSLRTGATGSLPASYIIRGENH